MATTGRLPGRQAPETESNTLCLVDRSVDREQPESGLLSVGRLIRLRAQSCARWPGTGLGRLERLTGQRALLSVFGRSTARSTGQRSIFDRLLLPVDRPVDRLLNQRATALWPVDRSVDWSKPESGLLSVGRLTRLRAQSCARPVDRYGRPAPSPVDCYGRPPEPGSQ